MERPVFHDVPPGALTYCQVCRSEKLELVIDLGHQAPCDSLLTSAQLMQPEVTYPLRLFRCIDCSLAQLDYVVPGDVVYFREYPYRAGITREVVEHHDASAAMMVERFGLDSRSLVVDIGSNDGTLLHGFKKRGTRVLGVEPTNIAQIAVQEGVETIQSPFTEALAREIVADHGRAAVVTATNVIAHMAALGDVMRGVEQLLADDGVFMTESHYLVDILKGVQYDTIYHEHIRSYSLKSLIRLFEAYDLSVVEAYPVERYAGTLRVFAMKGGGRPAHPSALALLAAEEAFGLYEREPYTRFRERTYRAKDALLELAITAKQNGWRLVGNSCPGRASTLLNVSGIRPDLMAYIAEQPTSLKLGLYLPGMHIPVVNNEILFREQPDYVVLLAWHYSQPIAALLRDRGLKSRLIVPLPEVLVLED